MLVSRLLIPSSSRWSTGMMFKSDEDAVLPTGVLDADGRAEFEADEDVEF